MGTKRHYYRITETEDGTYDLSLVVEMGPFGSDAEAEAAISQTQARLAPVVEALRSDLEAA